MRKTIGLKEILGKMIGLKEKKGLTWERKMIGMKGIMRKVIGLWGKYKIKGTYSKDN